MTVQDILNELNAKEEVEEAEVQSKTIKKEGEPEREEKSRGNYLSREIQRIHFNQDMGNDVMDYKWFDVLVKGLNAKFHKEIPDILKPPKLNRDPIFDETDIKREYKALDRQNNASHKVVSSKSSPQEDGDIVSLRIDEGDKIVSKRYLAYMEDGKKVFKELA